MRAARTLALAAACLVALWPQLGAHAQGEVILLVSPFEGYNGATFYVSGAGYTAGDQLAIYIACPNVGDPDVYFYHNSALYPGPIANINGTFAGFPIKGFNLNVLKSSPCAIRVNDVTAGRYFVCTLCAQYNIVAPQTPLPPSARFVSGKVHASPQRAHAGVFERISISGSWGGASAMVSIKYPDQRSRKFGPIHLDWRGGGERTVPIDKSVGGQPGKATVNVTFSLGDRHGSAATSFTVIR
jgi:hypothetical protein